MAKGSYLGEFEQLVLITLVRLGGDGYGAQVRREIIASTGRDVALGSVYATLDRLETKGYLRSRKSEPLPVPGGRGRRSFVVTPAGQRRLSDALGLLQKLTDHDFESAMAALESGS
ncbi:MAG: PadR family transcriptional regulator [Acidobacteria bacterium]|nr:PadR family transcriptional regulator [Acidobacteriota bacterium]